ncbi:OLC1v1032537C1 [Oldenlandia corymbosa var. corymbosa]|uniref:RING-type E3 ubiquitin transferase n=1 Tax=Oldenlandia corymbosa var. corymbosa TaxID=529605 RepID=A0AAV1CL06_OLDCO|nr:OLC1v1032537C1 [Oldenlandia corymbosa var. corymbosa]
MVIQLPYCHLAGEIMPGNASDWIMLMVEKRPHVSMVESLLSSISEVIESVVCIELQNEAFICFGSYLYRASAVIMELKMRDNVLKNTTQILSSLSSSIDLAKDLTKKGQQCAQSDQDSGINDILEDLQGILRAVGKDLNMIQNSLNGAEEHVKIAAKSLSKEMEEVNFVVSRATTSKNRKPEIRHVVASAEISTEEDTENETDLYSTDVEASMEYLLSSDKPKPSVDESLKKKNQMSWSGKSLMSVPEMAQYIEPLYETFFCPLTNKIMDDPVTIESGITYDRTAITEWFNKFEVQDEILCPKSGQKLQSKNSNTNFALKNTIAEWKERNETAKIKVARAALLLASTEEMILQAIADLQGICGEKAYNRVKIRNVEIIPVLAKLLYHESITVRCATANLLQQLAEGEDDGKEIVSKTVDLSKLIKMLSSNHRAARHASALLLSELSKSRHFGATIGGIAGGILMLITTKYRKSVDEYASEKAEEILRNLETSPDHIKCMAENGYWEPLLQNLVKGTKDMKIEMASFLGKIVLSPDMIASVAERTSSALLDMVRSGNSLCRSAAFQALRQISSNHSVHGRLVEAGILTIMVDEMFARTIKNEPVNSKNEAATILANICESGLELENLRVNSHGHTMASDYIVYNIISWIKHSTPEDLTINLIRMLLCLMKFPKASATIVSVVKETEASYNLIELINYPNEELGVAVLKLLITLSSFMGHTLCDRLCKTKSQLESLIQYPKEVIRITEKHSLSAKFLAKLPYQNITLNRALLDHSMVTKIVQSISWIQNTGTRTSRYTSTYLEGLVGTLVRFTTTLYDIQVLNLVRDYDFTSLFTELIANTSSDEVQKLSAMALKNLSEQSAILSKKPQSRTTAYAGTFKFMKCFSCNMSKYQMVSVCPVHKGSCSSQDSFCLIDAKAVERLINCLDHDNVEVVQAALSAICTLLDDKVDLDKSAKFFNDMHTVPHILNVIKEHKEEQILQKSFWMMDRILSKGGDEMVSDVSRDGLFFTTVVSSLHHGDDCTREMAEKILRHLNKFPDNSVYFTK